MTVKLQHLKKEYETLQMKASEDVHAYITRVSTIVNQMKVYGDSISYQTVAAKILRSLHPRFDHIVAAIEEARDLNTLTVEELSGSLKSHEDRINRTTETPDAKAFQVAGEASDTRRHDKHPFRGRGSGNFKGGRSRGRGERKKQ